MVEREKYEKAKRGAIVTDGACSLTPSQGEQRGVQVAPVSVNFEIKTYQASMNLEASEFYRLMHASKKLPTTALPTAADFINLFTRLADAVEEIVTIVISPHMRATLQSAEMAKEQDAAACDVWVGADSTADLNAEFAVVS